MPGRPGAEPSVSHPGQHPRHVERLAAYWAEVLGGPPAYSRDCNDHSVMLVMHSGNGGGMHDLGRRFVGCFVLAADDAELPDDPEFRAALRAYTEWAVGNVLSYPEPQDVPGRLAMPRWTWGGLESGGAVDPLA